MNILVQNEKFETVAMVDSFKSLIWTDRFNDIGDFELEIPINSKLLKYVNHNYYLITDVSEHVMIIDSIFEESAFDKGDFVTVSGYSLENILSRRIVWGFKSFKGNLQEFIEILLKESIIEPTIAERKIDNFIFRKSDDERITKLTVDIQCYGEELKSIIKDLCLRNNIGFKITLENNQFVFSLYLGVDRSYEQFTNPYVVFSPTFNNILNSSYLHSVTNYKNVTYIKGEGEGSNIVFTSIGEASGLDRRELFTDASDIYSNTDTEILSKAEYLEKIKTRGLKELEYSKPIEAFDGTVEMSTIFEYGKDFLMGDIVQMVNAYGRTGRVYISEAIASYDEKGQRIYPTFQIYNEKEVIEWV